MTLEMTIAKDLLEIEAVFLSPSAPLLGRAASKVRFIVTIESR